MSYFIRVFCRSKAVLTRQQLVEFIEDGIFFEEMPLFDPKSDLPLPGNGAWTSLIIHQGTLARPIVLHHNVEDEGLHNDVGERVEELGAVKQKEGKEHVLEHLRDSLQMLVIEIDPEVMTEEAWEMVDSIERYVAYHYDGLIYAPGEGYYDADLQSVLHL